METLSRWIRRSQSVLRWEGDAFGQVLVNALIGKVDRAKGVPGPENRDLRQLLWHRHRLVQMRTRIMNQLQALAMNEGYRWKKKLFSEQGRAQLEKLALAPWASRRRQELLELLDRMSPTIKELTAAVDQETKSGLLRKIPYR